MIDDEGFSVGIDDAGSVDGVAFPVAKPLFEGRGAGLQPLFFRESGWFAVGGEHPCSLVQGVCPYGLFFGRIEGEGDAAVGHEGGEEELAAFRRAVVVAGADAVFAEDGADGSVFFQGGREDGVFEFVEPDGAARDGFEVVFPFFREGPEGVHSGLEEGGVRTDGRHEAAVAVDAREGGVDFVRGGSAFDEGEGFHGVVAGVPAFVMPDNARAEGFQQSIGFLLVGFAFFFGDEVAATGLDG